MKPRLGGIAALLLALATTGRAETYGVTLAPWKAAASFGDARGSGFGALSLDGTTLAYTLYVRGLQPRLGYVEAADGTPVASFGLYVRPFQGELASGSVSVTQELADRIKADPSGYSLNLISDAYPGGALRGELAPPPSSQVFFPTVAKARGVNGASFVTDLSLLNRQAAGEPAAVTLDFFASSAGGLAGPTLTRSLSVSPGEQLVLKDLLAQLETSGDGALRVTAPAGVLATARVFNDQRAAGAGTTGLLVPASERSELLASGVLPLLSNASPADTAAGAGYRTNIGYFNPYPGTATVAFEAVRTADGATLGSATRTIPGYSRLQLPVFDLIPGVPEADRAQPDFYLTFRCSAGSALFAYAAVVDNKTGDGIYLKAAPTPAADSPASQAAPGIAGVWSGGGRGFTMTWRLSQAGNRVTGFVYVDADNGFDGLEHLSGTFDGTVFQLDALGLPGDHSFQPCTDVVAFTGTVSGSTLSGRYIESGTCDPGDSGIYTLTRQ